MRHLWRGGTVGIGATRRRGEQGSRRRIIAVAKDHARPIPSGATIRRNEDANPWIRRMARQQSACDVVRLLRDVPKATGAAVAGSRAGLIDSRFRRGIAAALQDDARRCCRIVEAGDLVRREQAHDGSPTQLATEITSTSTIEINSKIP